VVGAYLRRGLAAGVLAGLLAGLFGLLVGERSLDAAIALEERMAAASAHEPAVPAHEADSAVTIPRPLQKAGLVGGSALVGLAVGALFGVAAAWAVGRVEGDGWIRSLKLGAAALGVFVVLPGLKYPPNPPGVGDAATIGTRSTLYLGLILVGILLLGSAWSLARQLPATGLERPARTLAVGGLLGVTGAAVLALLPAADATAGLPGDLLWSFRLSALGAQGILCGGTAVTFGLLSARAERAHGPAR
jgi:hypothetical protein